MGTAYAGAIKAWPNGGAPSRSGGAQAMRRGGAKRVREGVSAPGVQDATGVAPSAPGIDAPGSAGRAAATPWLETHDLSKSFGAVFAVQGVNLAVPRGELRGIIGPNGAGKSTLFGLIAGHLVPDRGTISYQGQVMTGLAPYRRAEKRIAIVFQAARLFRGMTALENVMVGAHSVTHHGFTEAVLRLPRFVREERQIRERATEALERVGLAGLAGVTAESLPLGQQRSLQVARALCGDPQLLLLDEPASGLRAYERAALASVIGELRREGLTMLLIEHDVAFVNSLADTITVLDLGSVIAEGSPTDVWKNDQVVAAYLGTGADVA